MNRGIRNHGPLWVRMRCAILILSCLCGPGAGIRKRDTSAPEAFHVGYRILDFEYTNDNRKDIITVAVWYPTSARPKPYNYGGPTDGNVAVNAAPLVESGPYPMLVFSHGYGGSGIGSAFFTEALAARGWIVAAPDHNDSYSAVRIRSGQVEKSNRRDLYYAQAITISDPEDRDKYLYRLDEMSYVINRMVLSEEFRGVIDKNRIAVGGHSFGGYTALGLCGTIKERQDSRIKAVLLFSTGAGAYLFTEDELKAVRIPLMLFIGERERYQSRGAKTMAELGDKIYRNVSAPKYFLEIKGANHFSFNNRFEDSRVALLLSGSERQFDVIRRYSIAFLEKHVAGEKGFDRVLEQKHPLITRYLKKE